MNSLIDQIIQQPKVDTTLNQNRLICPADWFPGKLADWQIHELAMKGMIDEGYAEDPVTADPQGNRIITYGLSSYGYDPRMAPEFMLIKGPIGVYNEDIIDPKHPSDRHFDIIKADHVIIPPNSFALARTVEYFRIPDDVIGTCIGKSTYARVGCVTIVTPLQPGWEGNVTLEFANLTRRPMVLSAHEGSVQFSFEKGSSPCRRTYKGGVYQGQRGITTAKVRAA